MTGFCQGDPFTLNFLYFDVHRRGLYTSRADGTRISCPVTLQLFLNRVDFTSAAHRHRFYQLMRHGRDSVIMNLHSLDSGKPKLAQAFVDELARQKKAL